MNHADKMAGLIFPSHYCNTDKMQTQNKCWDVAQPTAPAPVTVGEDPGNG